ncbi:MAG: cobalamin biosynthesis protein CbiX [Betaproteobacteria bacterium]|nr:cobalamin biosynthesis protein CbiX [Betaproteobacteria bacterium]
MSTSANHVTQAVAARALVLFAHGSRDPLWHKPIQAVAASIARQSPGARVACAYLELSQPDLPQVTSELAAEGIGHITVMPMFLGVGRHAREDLPQLVAQLQGQYPDMVFQLMPAVGENPQVVDMLASVALKGL